MTEKIINRGAEQFHLRTNREQVGLGAEAVLIKENGILIKRRISKGYRIPVLDEKLRKLRTRSEAKIMEKLSQVISVPKIIKVDETKKEIVMEFISGKKLSENLDLFALNKQREICREIGKEISKVHDSNIIHGDLTTSNMILVEKRNYEDCCTNGKNSLFINKNCKNKNSGITEQEEVMKESKLGAGGRDSYFKIYLIDFGLGFHSSKIEDKAVDIHLFKQALESKHFSQWEKLFSSFLEGYNPRDKTKIIKQLKKVEARGRYKH